MSGLRAIRAPHVFDGNGFLPGGATVVLDGSTIAGVEPFGGALPDDVAVTEHDGTLLPGLIDCHVHLVANSTPTGLERVAGLDESEIDATIADSLNSQAAAGVTTVRDLGDLGYRTLAFRSSPGLPRVVAAGPPITTPGGHCHYLGGAVHEGDLPAAIAERVERGVDVVKVMASGGMVTPGSDVFGAQFSEPELRTLVDAAHEAGLPVVAHAHAQRAVTTAVAAGVDGLAHVSCLTESGPQATDDVLDAITAAGVTVDLTAGWDPSRLPPPELIPPQIQAVMARLGLDWEKIMEQQVNTARRLRDRGARLVTGLDAGISPAKAHGMAWRSVAVLLEAGFPVAEALACATSVAARDCGLSETCGVLAPGLSADLLVVDGDLATDVTALGRPIAVLVRGEPPNGVG